MPISHSDYEAALRRFGVELAGWEHNALDMMEAAWMGAVNDEIRADMERHAKG